jgi:hypothetical protein
MQPPPQQGMFPQQQPGGPAIYTSMQQGMGRMFCTVIKLPGLDMVARFYIFS